MKPKQTNLTIFAILTTLSLVTWALVEGYVRFYKRNLEVIPSSIVSPLNPVLDSTILENLKNKIQFSDQQILLYNTNKESFLETTNSENISTQSGTEGDQNSVQ